MNRPPFIDGPRVHDAVSISAAADAIEAALRAGLDPEAELHRTVMPVGQGQLLTMPASVGPHATVKVVTVGGRPRIQGITVVFDAITLAPVAAIDGVALTKLRTPAVSLVAARRMLRGPARHLVVFGRGPQGVAHAAALQAEFEIDVVTVLNSASEPAAVEAAVRSADLICCATNAREPLFDGDLVSDSAVVLAVGSHEPMARELDAALVERAAIVVESRRSALSEAGDLLMAGVDGDAMTTLAELVGGDTLPEDRPRLFKSTGMSWEDTVIASSVMQATLFSETPSEG
jgi:ornithine cyclodeaminase